MLTIKEMEWGFMGVYGNSVPSTQFFCKSSTALKIKVYLLKEIKCKNIHWLLLPAPAKNDYKPLPSEVYLRNDDARLLGRRWTTT